MRQKIPFILLLVVCLTLLLSVSVVAFEDVPESSPFYNAVSWCVDMGITNGTSETAFSPDSSCTRGEAVTFLWRAMAE